MWRVVCVYVCVRGVMTMPRLQCVGSSFAHAPLPYPEYGGVDGTC